MFYISDLDTQIDFQLKGANISTTLVNYFIQSDYIDMPIGKTSLYLPECLLENKQNHFFITEFKNTSYHEKDILSKIHQRYDMSDIYLLGSI